MATQTFMVADASGECTLPATQLATFTHYLRGAQYRFVVTELPGELPAVTHRGSGMRLGKIGLLTLAKHRDNPLAAGKAALALIIEQHGEERVAALLREAEWKYRTV